MPLLLLGCEVAEPVVMSHTSDLRLMARDRVIATGVVDPRPSEDGDRVVFSELPPGATEYQAGTPTRIVLMDLARGTRRVVSDHPLDSSPFVVPDSDEVLFVSGRTGVASLWLAAPGAPARQLTNRGLRQVSAGFVPVPSRELSFDGRRATFVATYGGVRETWRVDLDSGAAEVLR